MITQTAEPMAISQVQKTNDYTIFTELDGNRVINPLHVKRLVNSMSERLLFTAIYVNEKMQVIDGQHRLAALKELKKPINYIVIKGYGLQEVQILNANSKNWNLDDYLNGYCDLGLEDYKIYKMYKDRYRFGHKEVRLLLTGTRTDDSAKYGGPNEDFKRGTLKVTEYKNAVIIGDRLEMLGEFYEGYKRACFVRAIISLTKNENFIFTEFLQKLKLQPTALQDCTNISTYIALIEEIYNYKRRIKYNLRFSN